MNTKITVHRAIGEAFSHAVDVLRGVHDAFRDRQLKFFPLGSTLLSLLTYGNFDSTVGIYVDTIVDLQEPLVIGVVLDDPDEWLDFVGWASEVFFKSGFIGTSRTGWQECYLETPKRYVWHGQATSLLCARVVPVYVSVRLELLQADWSTDEPFLYQNRLCRTDVPDAATYDAFPGVEDKGCRYFSSLLPTSPTGGKVPISLVFPFTACRYEGPHGEPRSTPCPYDGAGLLRFTDAQQTGIKDDCLTAPRWLHAGRGCMRPV